METEEAQRKRDAVVRLENVACVSGIGDKESAAGIVEEFSSLIRDGNNLPSKESKQCLET